MKNQLFKGVLFVFIASIAIVSYGQSNNTNQEKPNINQPISKHAIGVEIGFNAISGSSLYGMSAPFFAIPYEFYWDSKTSFILKPSFSQNTDYHIVAKEYDIYHLKTSINVFRLSYSLERKFGNPEKKFFGSYRMGLGFGAFLNASYQQSAPNPNTPYNFSSSPKNKISMSETNLAPIEMFCEFGVSVGYRINQNWSVLLVRNNIIALTDSDVLGSPIITPLLDYDFIEYTRYRSFILGLNLKVVYHFTGK